jgi:hypothetical protein
VDANVDADVSVVVVRRGSWGTDRIGVEIGKHAEFEGFP